jgi:hypothetical protein
MGYRSSSEMILRYIHAKILSGTKLWKASYK